MKKAVFILLILFLASGFVLWKLKGDNLFMTQNQKVASPSPRPLDKYTIEALAASKMKPSPITVGKSLETDNTYKSYLFYFYVDGKKVSGVLNTPNDPGDYPVILMLRGYVDKEKYSSGIGSQPFAQFLAKKGYVTIAPDFLGYGESDSPSDDPMEERFQTYTTASTLISSIVNLNDALKNNSLDVKVQANKIGIWGHSNGGQIALTTLEIAGVDYPTVLWAPVSKAFPYSILYYTDDYDDKGKYLRKVIANFEKTYDSDKYSLINYFEKIQSPIQLNQGTLDEEVPQKWSSDLYDKLKKLGKNVELNLYNGANHNFLPRQNWNEAALKGLEFFNKNI